MAKTYELRDVVSLLDKDIGVSARQIRRWADEGIIRVGGGGSQGTRRDYTFRNLVEIVVCDELRGLGVGERFMRLVVQSLNTIWDQPDDPINSQQPDKPTYQDMTILWLPFLRLIHPVDGSDMEMVSIHPVDATELLSRLSGERDGSGIPETGIAIPIARIIANLERATGEVFDPYATFRKKLMEKAAALAATYAAKDEGHE